VINNLLLLIGDLTTGTSVNGSKIIPNNIVLHQNYPNPFNPSTTITFTIPINEKRETSNVRLIIYDVLGREVKTLFNDYKQPGTHEISWNGKNDDGNSVPSGMYVFQIKSNGAQLSRKMLMLK